MLLVGILAVSSATVDAATKYWDINGTSSGAGGGTTPNGTWSTTDTNWNSASGGGSGTISAWTSGDNAVFSAGGTATGAYTVTLSGTISVANITVEEGTVTLNSGTLQNSAAGSIWNGGSGLTINSAVDLNSKALTVDGTVKFLGNTTLSAKMTVDASSDVTLSGSNSGSGGVNLNNSGGILRLGSDTALGTGTLEWGTGTLFTANGNRTLTNSVTAVGNMTFSGADDLTLGALALNGSNRTLSVTSTGTLSLNGITGSNTLTKTGTGTLVTTGTSSYSAIAVTGGILQLNGTYTGSGNTTMDTAGVQLILGSDTALGSGTLQWGSGTLSAANGSRTLTNSVTSQGDMVFDGSSDLSLGALALNGADRTMTINGSGILSLNGINGANKLVKNGTGTLVTSGTSSNTGTTQVTLGTLLVNGTHITTNGEYNIDANSTGHATLGGTGTVAVPSGKKRVNVHGKSNTQRGIIAPGNGGTSVGTLNIGTAGAPTELLFGDFSQLSIDIDGATADRVTVIGPLTLVTNDVLAFNVVNTPTAGKYTVLSYTQTLTDSGTQGFSTVTGIPTGYRLSNNLNATGGTIDLIQKQVLSGTATPVNSTVITGGTTTLNFNATNSAGVGGDTLNQFTAAAGTNTTGSSTSGGPLTAGSSSANYTGFSFNSTGKPLGSNSGTITLTSTDAGVSSTTANYNVNVVDHASGSASVTAGNGFTTIVGATGVTATVNLANAAGTRSQLQVNASPTATTGSVSNPGSLLINAGSSQNYTATFNTPSLGAFNNTVTFTAGDNQSLPGASALGPISTTISGTVIDHASPSTSVTSGNNFTAIVGATGLSANVNLANASGSRSQLQVNASPTASTGSVSNPGALLINPGSSQNYTANFNAGATAGAFADTITFTAGDNQSLAGASALAGVAATITGTVLDHSHAEFRNNATPGSGSKTFSPDRQSLTINFGTQAVGIGSLISNFDILNAIATVGYTAMLDLDSITLVTASAALSLTGPGTFTNLAAGSRQAYSAVFDTSVAGSFVAVYQLNFSDENLAGGTAAGSQHLLLTINGAAAVGVPSPSAAAFGGLSLLLAMLRRPHRNRRS